MNLSNIFLYIQPPLKYNRIRIKDFIEDSISIARDALGV
jgi:hypothetical protein